MYRYFLKTKIFSFYRNFFAMLFLFLNASHGSGIENWNNEEFMRPYYTAISFIRNQLESCIDRRPKYVSNGFIDWPTPNNSSYRTPKYLYLKTSGKSLSRLYTPFGEVFLLGSGVADNMDLVSKKVSKNYGAQLENIRSYE